MKTTPPLPGDHEPHDAQGLSSASHKAVREAVDDTKDTGLGTAFITTLKRIGKAMDRAKQGDRAKNDSLGQ